MVGVRGNRQTGQCHEVKSRLGSAGDKARLEADEMSKIARHREGQRDTRRKLLTVRFQAERLDPSVVVVGLCPELLLLHPAAGILLGLLRF